jgi:SAM-dependent methyltransferase
MVKIRGVEIDDRGRVELMMEYLPLDLACFKGKSVLDIGCNGGWWSFLAEEVGAKEVLGIDVDSDMIALARTNGKRIGSKVKFETVSVEDMKTRKFDIILLLAILHHLSRPEYAIEKVAGLCSEKALIELQIHREGHYGEHSRYGRKPYHANFWEPNPGMLVKTIFRFFRGIELWHERWGRDGHGRVAFWAMP